MTSPDDETQPLWAIELSVRLSVIELMLEVDLARRLSELPAHEAEGWGDAICALTDYATFSVAPVGEVERKAADMAGRMLDHEARRAVTRVIKRAEQIRKARSGMEGG